MNAVGGDGKSLLHHTPLLRALRIALGTALFVVFFTALSSSGAFAASDSQQGGKTSYSQAPAKGKALLSGILSPVADAADTTGSQVPVVRDIPGNNTVAKVVVPVVTVADRVETAVNSVPVVGEVVAPVRNATNSVVPPAVNVVGAVKPVIDGVTDSVGGGVANVVDQVLTPVAPVTPGTPGTDASGLPGSIDGVNPDRANSELSAGPHARQGENHGKPAAGVQTAPRSAHVGTLAEYLAIAPSASTASDGPSSNAGVRLSMGGAGYASCGRP